MKSIAILSLALISASAFASADEDVGTCMAYMVKTARGEAALQAAMNMAANGAVALQYAKISMRKPLELSEGDACRRIGIYPSKWKVGKLN